MPFPFSQIGLVEWETELDEQAAIEPFFVKMKDEFRRRRLGHFFYKVGPGAGLAEFDIIHTSALFFWEGPRFKASVDSGEVGLECRSDGAGYRLMVHFKHTFLPKLLLLCCVPYLLGILDTLLFSGGTMDGIFSKGGLTILAALVGLSLLLFYGPTGQMKGLIEKCAEHVDKDRRD